MNKNVIELLAGSLDQETLSTRSGRSGGSRTVNGLLIWRCESTEEGFGRLRGGSVDFKKRPKMAEAVGDEGGWSARREDGRIGLDGGR